MSGQSIGKFYLSVRIKSSAHAKSYKYQIDRLFDGETTTGAIYTEAVAKLIPFACVGGIATLFAYGQSDSGKTFTISRLEELAIQALMNGSSTDDALPPHGHLASGVTQLVGAVEVTATSQTQFFELVEQAASFRRSVPTLHNAASSRSHAICRIRIRLPERHQLGELRGKAKDGFLHMIELAGSEPARDVVVHDAELMRKKHEISMKAAFI
ncbi:P-loop containing nucleoside triphosphate hydrolase protein [Microdochium bolleyi]|uniref:p-loop containing nucleoside triphosphate hydrolase protein n=1 Tax=Microdochium bolleyi TaxID=196109 RepID=A0A136IYH6_9PEZI|nr:P-loop containing nucleoside triphosphate hydrolase protein [Microdochium bolleyi]